ncbi:response regulator [Pedobacter boryungensis]|uniref:histidine kinase n=1 Tax=Pedobacter boryungensis TaxID=869962 RepID=A0ABX2DG76_9SPHI|nr:response regulator [Pedobacter boryungensis]NQX32149.1 response regulator [Pedobacter boryungensis]
MNKVNLLIVDDKPENIIALEAVLDQQDINIISTTSPNEALRICWEKDIALALVDVQMPGMNGFELVEILKSNAKTQDIMVIFVTAISLEVKYALKGLNAGAIDYLYKPLDPYVTAAKVDSFIELIRTQREIKNKNQQLEKFQKELIKAKNEAELSKKAKENFMANMSHEIRTPINGIIGLINLLKKTELDNNQKEMLGLLEVSSESLLGVINDILDISKIEAGKFRINYAKTDIRLILTQATNLLDIRAKEKKLDLKLEIPDDLPEIIIADSLRLNQIFMNLLSNAVKFTQKGEIKLKAEVLGKKTNTVQIRFSVIDSGIGISPADQAKIFDKFEQIEDHTIAQHGGTGLGLAIVKKLVELKGGTLELTSKEGEGSTFSFTKWYEFMAEDKTKKDGDNTNETEILSSLKGLKVLVAEDNIINKFVLLKVLDGWEVKSDVVGNGLDVLEILKTNDYDVILMDTYMPGMNGLEVTEKIRTGFIEGKENIPIITFTAGVLETDKETSVKAGANDILSKPFKPAILHQKIKIYLK